MSPLLSTPARRVHRFEGLLTPRTWLWVLGASSLVLIGLFLFYGIEGGFAYAVNRRLLSVITMVLVAYAVGMSTVLFQTVTNNRILTPSIMGFDALYLLIQTAAVFLFSAGALTSAPEPLKFVLNTVLMTGFAIVLYRWVFTGQGRSLHLLLLIGIVFGTLFRGIASLLQRLMDPSEYIILQDLFFASFNRTKPDLLPFALLALVVVSIPVVLWRHQLDVMNLGREVAISLGVHYKLISTGVLVIAAVMISVSTALVGPVTFFGVLVANLAYQVSSGKHRYTLPAAVLIGVIALIGGQFLLSHVLGLSTALSIIIDFVGGIVFIALLLRGRLR
ncbi:iron chelate uptake ABC transporter family permease subunit [Micrococcoides hystricis]|uniref:Iron chelate uptake ABC transporter family permease subunit n=1 Tax=Micrococcoides hystricis TaxID=1572761 RepID=A0ABV6P9X4_9MICC